MAEYDQILRAHAEMIGAMGALGEPVREAARRMVAALRGGCTIYWFGNGGSAADSQHLASELVGRFQREREGLASFALTTDASVLTSLSNDFGYEQVFARQLQAVCRPGDVAVGISTSGNSPNVLAGVAAARAAGGVTIGMTGAGGGALAGEVDLCLSVPSEVTARVQEGHILLGHTLCELIEDAMLEAGDDG
jgi:D-sedoheptulose 7-phosphate isomerase